MTTPEGKRRSTLLLAAVFVGCVAIGAAAATTLFLGAAPRSGDLGSTGRALVGGPFTLVDGSGATVTEAILSRPVNFVYFGFTHCPDFCPTELANLAVARDALKKRGVESRIFFVSVDPKRDTPEVVGAYAKFFDDDAVGLTGSDAQVKAAAAAYGVYYNLAEPDENGAYAVDHSTLVYAMDDAGALIRFFRANTDPEEIAASLAKELGGRT